jgi:hypothetical protein
MMKNFIKKSVSWSKKKFSFRFLISIIITFFVGFILRYLLKEYFSIDVLKDITSYISILYYSFMIIFTSYIHEVLIVFIIEIFAPNFMMPAGGPSGGSTGPLSGNNTNVPASSGTPPPTTPPNYAPTTDEGLITDNRELPLDVRKADWNRPDPTQIPYGTRAMDYSTRYGRGEPMDIAMPTTSDKRYLFNLLNITINYMNNHVTYNNNPLLSKVLQTLEEEGNRDKINVKDEGERAFGVYKQIRKIIYNEPQFHKYINSNTDRVEWSKIKVGQNSEFMNYLNRNS